MESYAYPLVNVLYKRQDGNSIFSFCGFYLQVQLRQKTDQKKTLYYVEQLLIKYDATKECSAIKTVGGKKIMH